MVQSVDTAGNQRFEFRLQFEKFDKNIDYTARLTARLPTLVEPFLHAGRSPNRVAPL